MRPADLPTESIELHGHAVTYHRAGEGPPLLLLHGITSSSQTWRRVVPLLARHHTVIAPDLLGHGESAKPRGDYSLGAYASGARDLLLALGFSSATVVGHSMGGGIAMQFAYQFPRRVERMALVSSGGLGREVNLVLRAATLPGAEWVLPVASRLGILQAGMAFGDLARRVGLQPAADLEGLAEGFASLHDAAGRRAFLHTVRSILDLRGQRISATDRLYLAEQIPTLLVWGERDRIIPVEHGRAAHASIPGSRLEVFPDAGHFPFNDDPMSFAELLTEWVATTAAAEIDEDDMRELLARGGRLAA